MLQIDVPGYKILQLEHLVLDFNGTLACDGILLPQVAEKLTLLAKQIGIDIITADTHGSATQQIEQLPVNLIIIPPTEQDQAKLNYIEKCGVHSVVTIGNGYNDHLMLKSAALGIAVMQQEGAATQTIQAANILTPNILSALDLLIKPKRLIATLRN